VKGLKKAAVIGAGISGMVTARSLRDRYRVTVFEKEDRPGGLIRCREVQGSLFHTCGGHVFNSRRQDVMDWFRGLFDWDCSFVKADRNACIVMPDGSVVGYPVEDHLYQLPEAAQRAAIRDFAAMVRREEKPVATHFAGFLEQTFGKTLCDLYFRPYNEKIWHRPLTEVPLEWLAGKLPMPSPEDVFLHNFTRREERTFVHASFWYPRRGGSQFLADTLADGLDIRYGASVDRMTCHEGKWRIGDEWYDIVVYTGNVRELPAVVEGVSFEGLEKGLLALPFHGTTAVFCEIDPVPYTWVYLPDGAYDAHRIICTGNLSKENNAPGRLTATVEFTEDVSREEIEGQLKRIPLNPKYLDHHFTPCSYPVQTYGTRDLIRELKDRLAPKGFYLTGRFAEWEYYNMDVAAGAAMDLASRL
jgi:protoporphyrinogen oxidase